MKSKMPVPVTFPASSESFFQYASCKHAPGMRPTEAKPPSRVYLKCKCSQASCISAATPHLWLFQLRLINIDGHVKTQLLGRTGHVSDAWEPRAGVGTWLDGEHLRFATMRVSAQCSAALGLPVTLEISGITDRQFPTRAGREEGPVRSLR